MSIIKHSKKRLSKSNKRLVKSNKKRLSKSNKRLSKSNKRLVKSNKKRLSKSNKKRLSKSNKKRLSKSNKKNKKHSGGFLSSSNCSIASVKEPGFHLSALGSGSTQIPGFSIPDQKAIIFDPKCAVSQSQAGMF
jgi:exonuclease VII large subunit